MHWLYGLRLPEKVFGREGAGRQLNRLLSLSNLRAYCEQIPRSNAHMSKLLRAALPDQLDALDCRPDAYPRGV